MPGTSDGLITVFWEPVSIYRNESGIKRFPHPDTHQQGGAKALNGRYFAYRVRTYVQLARPQFLLASPLLFLIGALATGIDIDWSSYAIWAALLSVVLVQLSTGLINEYADWTGDRYSRRTFFTGGSGVLSTGRAEPQVALFLGLVTGTLSLWLAYLVTAELSDRSWFLPLVGLGLALGWSYSLPPIRLVSSGFGELMVALMMGFLTPLLGTYFATGGWHVYWELSLPLTLFSMASTIAVEYPDKQADIRSGKRNLTYRLGVKRAAALQTLISFTGFAVLIIYVLLGSLDWWVAIILAILPFIWAAGTVMTLGKYYEHFQAGVAAGVVSFSFFLLIVLLLLELV